MMKRTILSMALIALGSITAYGQGMLNRGVSSSAATTSAADKNLATSTGYHILDLRKMDLDKGTNLTKLKIQPVPEDRNFRNELAADETLQEFIFINKEPGGQKLVVLLPKLWVLATARSSVPSTGASGTPATILRAPATTKVYDGNTPVESIPATKIEE
ncbi:hypothetical protein [Pedobacter sp. NJ-S-72]